MLTMKELEKLVDEQIRIFYVDANNTLINSKKEELKVLRILESGNSYIKVLVSL